MPTKQEKVESPAICPYCLNPFAPRIQTTIAQDAHQDRYAVITIACENCFKVVSSQAIPMVN